MSEADSSIVHMIDCVARAVRPRRDPTQAASADWVPGPGPLPLDPLSGPWETTIPEVIPDWVLDDSPREPEEWLFADPDALPPLPDAPPPLPDDPASPAEMDRSEVAAWRDTLMSTGLPRQQAALIDLIRELEDLKSTAAAIQAKAAVAFETARRRAEAEAGMAKSKRGRGISAEIALARRESPHKGGRLLGLAKALVTELPCTLAALAAGTVNEWRATLVARETACLDADDRPIADRWLADHLAAHPTIGDKRLAAEVRRKVIELDQHAVVARRAAAAGNRRVTTRAMPDGMVQFSAILPLREGVAVYAALKQAADRAHANPAAGETRGRGAIMADTLVERVTGQPARDPANVTVNVVITDQALLGETEEPAHVDGYGPISAAWVRNLIAATADSVQRIALRRLFRGPGRLIRMETASRRFTTALRQLIALRDQWCRTPWCGAPIRHVDHAHDHARGGPSSYLNGQGLCEACNYAKQATGWRSTVHQDPERGHVVDTTTPTGHTYPSTQPIGPGD